MKRLHRPETQDRRTARSVLGAFAGLAGLSTVAGVLVAASLTPALALSGAATSTAITMFDRLPSVLDIGKPMLPTTFWVKNPDTGEEQVLTQFYDQNRSQVDFDQIAPVMYDAILSSEDPRYYQHSGVDLIGTARALLSNAQGGGETQGGSSISQQYVKNILIQKCERDAEAGEKQDENGEIVQITREQALLECWTEATTAEGDEGIIRKLQEMRYAIALERKYSKSEILLGYLNIANFGGTTYGIDAAARYYFGVSAAELSLPQAATLAGIVQNPNTYRIDKPTGSMFGAEDVAFNKAPDGAIDDVKDGQLAALDTMLARGEITQEQYLLAADGYSATKGRQLYVLSRMLDDGRITQEQYRAAVLEPITPSITPPRTGCAAATGAEYFCQYARMVVERDPAFGETTEERVKNLRQGGLNIYLTLDWRVQNPARDTVAEWAPSSLPGMSFGTSATSVEVPTGRVLSIAQNTNFRDGDSGGDPNFSSIVYAGDLQFGGSNGLPAGSTFKLFTLIDWLEQGKSLNQLVDGVLRPPKRMTNSCTGDWTNTSNWRPNNSGGTRGYVGTPMQFTRDSLNSGYVAMAAELDLCDIANVVKKMGVTYGDGSDIPMAVANDVIGSANVSPLAMAGAFATVANNGVHCQPTVIDKVTDYQGNELPKPARICTQVLDPAVAATAATALQGVMYGGTGDSARPRDGVPVMGKTGTHEYWQTWMAEASTRVATVVWVGNSTGEVRLDRTYTDRDVLHDLRYPIARQIQAAANAAYGGDRFPDPDTNLMRQVLEDLPDVLGMTVDESRSMLEAAGFGVVVGQPVDSDRPEGTVAAQTPNPGKVAGGTVVTINPSNAQAVTVPDVAGRSFEEARLMLLEAGFATIITGTCTEESTATKPRAIRTNPSAGSLTNRAPIVVDYAAAQCGTDAGNAP
ncbi:MULTISPECIES: transglycosylase domain-containing protein [Microbacterium]|uniref:PASTA domain-containing protein n=1 Tax=Microbacterium wangchenii TaxID=2541726 RepID=A0ABX5SV58_9MICO|nr:MULTISPECIES: transglycosylase domain-containing protein [Microbacterium]MCK6068496.1 transglycosylase domain-containing protein [Microbacterium sp. EYE_512]QBR90044.1 PASTA domain-containing protein [Microbacterium wangchenii]TFV85104.1 PASTA domain-containing protein [Microbacterium sp. dk485]TXK09236.1 PASTA domain-containing protein [Microbacterium wangchenii]